MDSRYLSGRSLVFDNADPYAVSGYVNQHVGSHHIRLPRGANPRACLSHRKFANLDLCRISYGGSIRVTSPALETVYHLQVLLNGGCLWRSRNREHYLTPGELLLINPDDPVDLTYSNDCEKFIIKMPKSLLDSACAEQRLLLPEGGVRFIENCYELVALEGFLNLLVMVCNEAEANHSSAKVQEYYTQIIASKMLSLMKTNLKAEAMGCQEVSFERLADYIDRNLKQDIDSAALATQANMSLRSLYTLFERNAKTTPKLYIRQKKLERINRYLSDPQCQVRSVTELALDYGFLHLGRFAESYRQVFGELPSQTLKRRYGFN
jgi:AraC-like DNA-binding protein